MNDALSSFLTDHRVMAVEQELYRNEIGKSLEKP